MDRLVLTGAERSAFDTVVRTALADADLRDPATFADRAVCLAARTPTRLREFLADVRVREADVAVVSGLPLEEDLPPTPVGWERAHDEGAGRYAELVLLLCGAALAEPIGWSSQQLGRIVHDVCPSPRLAESMTSGSSTAGLTLHTEDAFHECRADYVALHCLRNPDEVGTTVARWSDLGLSGELRRILSMPRFRFRPDDSHGAGAAGAAAPAATVGPVVFGPPGRSYLRFDEDFTEAVAGDAEAAEALVALRDLCRDAAGKVVLRPGDAVFIDNYRTVHGRAPFRARYDGTDRWMKRLNLVRDTRRVYATTGRADRVIA